MSETHDHPLIALGRESPVIAHKGRVYFPTDGRLYEGPSLAALERRYLLCHRDALEKRVAYTVRDDLQRFQAQLLKPCHKLVRYVIEDVFPHLRTSGTSAALPAAAGKEAMGEALGAFANALSDAEAHRARPIADVATDWHMRTKATRWQRFKRAIRAFFARFRLCGRPLNLPEFSDAGSETAVERALGGASVLIANGTPYVLFPHKQGDVNLGDGWYRAQDIGLDLAMLGQAIDYHIDLGSRIAALREAARQGADAPEFRALQGAVDAGRIDRDDHGFVLRGEDWGSLYLVVPPFALRDFNGQYHAYPSLEIALDLRISGNAVYWRRPYFTDDRGRLHPFWADSDGRICLGSFKPPQKLPDGQQAAAYLLMAKRIVLSGYRSYRGTDGRPDQSLEDIEENLISKKELARKGLPVTNVDHQTRKQRERESEESSDEDDSAPRRRRRRRRRRRNR